MQHASTICVGAVLKNTRSWADLHSLHIVRAGEMPIFRQVYMQMRSAILAGTLRPGTKLPSTRDLAMQLAVSRSAMVSAYEQLLAEGYTSGRVGSGTYISSDIPEAARQRSARAKRPAPIRRAAAPQTPFDADLLDATRRNDDRPFNLGRTLLDARTVDVWRKLSLQSVRSISRMHLGYSDPRGLPELRRSICDYLQAARSVRCDPEQIVVTGGTQQSIDIVIRVLLGPGKQVWMEDPGYPLTRQALLAAGVEVRPVRVDTHGLDVHAGIRAAPSARAVFVTPSHQFPTGVVLSMGRRLELLEWAQQNDAWIVEDDYASEFRYSGRPLASLQGLDDTERVIYIGTLNKALFPGLRLGYVVVPHALLKAFVAARYLMDRHSSTLDQAVVASFMAEGHFASHIRRIRLLYQEQRDTLASALKKRLGDELKVAVPDQGMHLVAYTRKGLSDISLERAAAQKGVIVKAMSRLYAEAPVQSALMFGFSGYPRQTIAPAVARLALVLKQQ
jgi:GntR family transcriptional regulator/MocR family aminotransferase